MKFIETLDELSYQYQVDQQSQGPHEPNIGSVSAAEAARFAGQQRQLMEEYARQAWRMKSPADPWDQYWPPSPATATIEQVQRVIDQYKDAYPQTLLGWRAMKLAAEPARDCRPICGEVSGPLRFKICRRGHRVG